MLVADGWSAWIFALSTCENSADAGVGAFERVDLLLFRVVVFWSTFFAGSLSTGSLHESVEPAGVGLLMVWMCIGLNEVAGSSEIA